MRILKAKLKKRLPELLRYVHRLLISSLVDIGLQKLKSLSEVDEQKHKS